MSSVTCDRTDYKIKYKDLHSKETLHSKKNVVITYGNKPYIIPLPLSVDVGTKC